MLILVATRITSSYFLPSTDVLVDTINPMSTSPLLSLCLRINTRLVHHFDFWRALVRQSSHTDPEATGETESGGWDGGAATQRWVHIVFDSRGRLSPWRHVLNSLRFSFTLPVTFVCHAKRHGFSATPARHPRGARHVRVVLRVGQTLVLRTPKHATTTKSTTTCNNTAEQQTCASPYDGVVRGSTPRGVNCGGRRGVSGLRLRKGGHPMGWQFVRTDTVKRGWDRLSREDTSQMNATLRFFDV